MKKLSLLAKQNKKTNMRITTFKSYILLIILTDGAKKIALDDVVERKVNVVAVVVVNVVVVVVVVLGVGGGIGVLTSIPLFVCSVSGLIPPVSCRVV
jgi:hypothetical protein